MLVRKREKIVTKVQMANDFAGNYCRQDDDCNP